ncbi:MAG: hypothetical protein ACLS7Z_12785 [Christensenellales bacterium]
MSRIVTLESDMIWRSFRRSARRRLHRRMLADGSSRFLRAGNAARGRASWRHPGRGAVSAGNPDQIPLRMIPPIKPQLIEVANGELTLEEWMSRQR